MYPVTTTISVNLQSITAMCMKYKCSVLLKRIKPSSAWNTDVTVQNSETYWIWSRNFNVAMAIAVTEENLRIQRRFLHLLQSQTYREWYVGRSSSMNFQQCLCVVWIYILALYVLSAFPCLTFSLALFPSKALVQRRGASAAQVIKTNVSVLYSNSNVPQKKVFLASLTGNALNTVWDLWALTRCWRPPQQSFVRFSRPKVVESARFFLGNDVWRFSKLLFAMRTL